MTTIKGTRIRVTRLDEVGNPLPVQVNDIVLYTPPSGSSPFAAWVVNVGPLDDTSLVEFWRWLDGEWRKVVGKIMYCEVLESLDNID